MGTSQFYSPLKTSVDSIETLSNTISADVTTVRTLVNDMKSTDMGALDQQIQVVTFGYNTEIFDRVAVGTVSAGVWKSVYSITGEGFVTGIHQPTISTFNTQCRITIDGVLIYRGGGSGQANMSLGLCTQGGSIYDSTVGGICMIAPSTMRLVFNNSTAKKKPYINATETSNDQGWIYTPKPRIKFNSSLLIEVKVDTAGTYASDYLTIVGGMK